MTPQDVSIENFPEFLHLLDLDARRPLEMSQNLLTAALLLFLEVQNPALAERVQLSRVKVSNSQATFATIFIRAGTLSDDRAFTALGLRPQDPDDQVFQDRVFPPSLDLNDHWRDLLADPRLPGALVLVELEFSPNPTSSVPDGRRWIA